MCVSKHEVRPGLAGIVDHIDVIEEIKRKVTPVLQLLILAEEIKNINALDNEELSNLGALLRDLLDEAWAASAGIYKIFREETERKKGGA